MDAWVIVLIVVAVLVVLALLLLMPRMRRAAVTRARERELDQRRENAAAEERRAAEQRRVEAEQAEARANVAAAEAQRNRAEAELREERAGLHERGLADDELIDESERDRFSGTSARLPDTLGADDPRRSGGAGHGARRRADEAADDGRGTLDERGNDPDGPARPVGHDLGRRVLGVVAGCVERRAAGARSGTSSTCCRAQRHALVAASSARRTRAGWVRPGDPSSDVGRRTR